MTFPKLIGIYSPVRQHGKTTVAEVFNAMGYRTHKFAGVLYAMWRSLCDEVGLPKDVYAKSLTTLKETPLAQVGGLSFRTFAEGIGTKWGREMVDQDLWVRIARAAITSKLAGPTCGRGIVVDDMRFGNEFDLIKSMGGLTVKVYRPITMGGAIPSLPSEGHLEDARRDFDVVFCNDSTKERLQERVGNWPLFAVHRSSSCLTSSTASAGSQQI